MERNEQRHSALLVALAGVCWSFAGVLSRFTPWTAFSLAGFRSIIAVLLLGAIRKSFRPRNTLWNWVGALGVATTSTLFMLANKLTSAANAIVLQYAMTAIVIVVQIVFFHVRPRKLDVGAAALVMVGVVLCFCQGLGRGQFLGDLMAFGSAFTWAVVFLAARMPGVDSLSYAYQGNLLACLFLVCMPFDPAVRAAGIGGWIVPVGMGLCLGLGYLCFALGMRSQLSPTVAAIVANIEPVLNPMWVLIFLGEGPGMLSFIGAAVVLVTVTVYSLRSARHSAERQQ